ncbi:MAG: polysaccharide biosynthesis C-terminal domain-containing protein [Roseovarius sp.]|nr:polysaccharide biosynthesis C-terminal domain-containing protein [Roseovarius sp.]
MRWLMSGSVPILLGMIFSFLGTAFVARMVGPSVFGEYIFFLTWISVVALLAKSGHEWTLLKIIPGRLKIGALGQIRYLLRRAFLAVMLRAVIGAVILIGLAVFSGRLSDPLSLVLGFALVLVLAFAELRRSWALAHRAVWLSDAPESIAKSLVLAGTVAVFVALGVDVKAGTLLALNLSITFVTAVVATLIFLRLFAPALLLARPEPLPRDLSDTRGVVQSMGFAALANISMRNLDLIMLGLLVDAATLGLYAAASRLGLLAAGPIMVLDRLVAPVLAEAVDAGDPVKLESTAKRFVLLAGAGSASILGAFFMLGESIIEFSFGVNYVEGLIFALIIMTGNLVAALAGPAGVVMILGGAHRESAMITAMSALASLALLALFTPMYGAIGAAIATALAISLKAIISAIVVERRLHIKTTFVLFLSAPRLNG